MFVQENGNDGRNRLVHRLGVLTPRSEPFSSTVEPQLPSEVEELVGTRVLIKNKSLTYRLRIYWPNVMNDRTNTNAPVVLHIVPAREHFLLSSLSLPVL